MEKITCVICKTKIPANEVSQYAAYGGLPSPCCKICFEVNDYNIKDLGELQIKSLLRRLKDSPKPGDEPPTTAANNDTTAVKDEQ